MAKRISFAAGHCYFTLAIIVFFFLLVGDVRVTSAAKCWRLLYQDSCVPEICQARCVQQAPGSVGSICDIQGRPPTRGGPLLPAGDVIGDQKRNVPLWDCYCAFIC